MRKRPALTLAELEGGGRRASDPAGEGVFGGATDRCEADAEGEAAECGRVGDAAAFCELFWLELESGETSRTAAFSALSLLAIARGASGASPARVAGVARRADEVGARGSRERPMSSVMPAAMATPNANTRSGPLPGVAGGPLVVAGGASGTGEGSAALRGRSLTARALDGSGRRVASVTRDASALRSEIGVLDGGPLARPGGGCDGNLRVEGPPCEPCSARGALDGGGGALDGEEPRSDPSFRVHDATSCRAANV
jgi:hypothetical protein